ncbi:MAG TPA: helix-turn-helix domain-containing protein [Steroidobacteraceae bacterium]|nr:helix-turn-helix domain-containing protein [Steroidobacteraceae bacterium]
MPDSETTVVFKILRVLARQSDANHPLSLEQIAGATHMKGAQALRYLALLKRWGVVRADSRMAQGVGYRLTRYGQHRAAVAAAH